MRHPICLVLTVISVILTPLSVTEEAQAKPKWEKAAATGGVVVYNRPVEGSELREVKAVGLVMHPIDRVWEVVSDIDHYVEFMPYIEGIKILERGENFVVAYHQFDAPLVDPRDYTLKINWRQDKDKGVYVRSWRVARGKGPKPHPDYVRVSLANGSWTLKKLGPNKTRATYHLHTDPAGNIPIWIANKANSVSLPDLFKAVRNRSKNPKWRP